MAKAWAALPDHYSRDAVYDQYRAARRASVDLLLGLVPLVGASIVVLVIGLVHLAAGHVAGGIFLAVLALFMAALFGYLILLEALSPALAPHCKPGVGP